MEDNGYPAVDSEKTIFMKRVNNNFIIHGLFVYDMMHIPTNNALSEEFMDIYSKDFDITGGALVETFLGMDVEQSDDNICLHLYISRTLSMNIQKLLLKLSARRIFQVNLECFSHVRTALSNQIHLSRGFICP